MRGARVRSGYRMPPENRRSVSSSSGSTPHASPTSRLSPGMRPKRGGKTGTDIFPQAPLCRDNGYRPQGRSSAGIVAHPRAGGNRRRGSRRCIRGQPDRRTGACRSRRARRADGNGRARRCCSLRPGLWPRARTPRPARKEPAARTTCRAGFRAARFHSGAGVPCTRYGGGGRSAGRAGRSVRGWERLRTYRRRKAAGFAPRTVA